MRRIICAVLSLFLSLSLWVNAWPQQSPVSGSSENSPATPSLPKISVSPTSVNCGSLNPGGTSESAVTIKNSGKADLIISLVTLSGNNPSDFSQTNHCSTIAAGSSCAVTVTFSPTSGGKKSATLSIASNDPKKPALDVKLSGSAKSPACSYSLSSLSQQCDASGGAWTVDVTASSGCPWTATTKTSWITINSGGSGSGSGTVAYTVAPNSSGRQRSGKMTIAKQTFTVTQSGASSCTYAISPASQNFDSTGGTGSVGVTAQGGCNWTATSNANWITITSGASGSGTGNVGYSVSANTGVGQRTGTMTIAGQTLTVTQGGAAPSCTYSISLASQDFSAAGGTGSVGVTAQSGCSWTAASNAGWITITSGASGSGAGNVGYSVSANTVASQRTGTMTIAGQTFTVTQSGITCMYSISSASKSFDSTGGAGSVGVTAQNGCNWTTASNAGWITVTSAASGSGNGTVTYTVESNASIDQRSGTMTIAGQTFTVTQSGADSPPLYTLSEYQQALLDSYGEPDYLTIAFNSDPQRREETWVYTDLQKTYLFWDGVSLGETSIAVDPDAYSNPPYVDPSLFTKDMQLADLVELLGSDYAAVDQSSLKDLIDDVNFKVYNFIDEGLFVSFLDGNLVAVQTIDIPKGTGVLSTVKSLSGKEKKAGIGAGEILASGKISIKGVINILYMAAAIYHLAGINFLDDPEMVEWMDNSCGIMVRNPDDHPIEAEVCIKYAIRMLMNAAEVLQNQGLELVANQADTVNTATTKCSGNASAPPSSVPFQSTGNFAAAAGDQFPYCPGTAKQCTDYAYSPWSACGPDGTQTRQVTGKIPSDCNIEPPYPSVTTQSCTPPCTDYTYSDWSACSNGKNTRTVISKIPAGCFGDPDPAQLARDCPPCDFQYTDCIEDCRPNGLCAVNVITPVLPEGCAGVPKTTKECTYTPPQCTYTYSGCTGPCQPDGRCPVNVIGYSPIGCTGTPDTTKPCPQCTSYTSSDSACQPNVPWNGIVGLGTITTTYTGVPTGCVGGITIPQPTTKCCDGFNPC